MSNQDRYEECPLCKEAIKEALHEHLPSCDQSNSRVDP